jgi:hypothetical protein
MSYESFLNYWGKAHPGIRLRKPSEDICGKCFIYYQDERQNKRLENKESVSVDDYSFSSD